ncbi:MAG: head GIN domain-containing protein [Pseudomonadota bacterium]
MPRLAFIAVAPFFLVPLSAAETQSYDLPEFNALSVSAGIELEFAAGAPQSVTVENADNDFDDIKLSVRDGMLDIERPRRFGINLDRPRYKVTVTAPVLSHLDVSSGADAVGTGLSGPDVSVEVSSGSNANVSAIDGGRVDLETNSGADLIASGSCEEIHAETSSGSDLDASELICATGRAEASSGSDLSIHARQAAQAEASSGADIHIHGAPETVRQDTSSGGDVMVHS